MLRSVAPLLWILLRVKSLTINTCCGVAGFLDLHINVTALLLACCRFCYRLSRLPSTPKAFGVTDVTGFTEHTTYFIGFANRGKANRKLTATSISPSRLQGRRHH